MYKQANSIITLSVLQLGQLLSRYNKHSCTTLVRILYNTLVTGIITDSISTKFKVLNTTAKQTDSEPLLLLKVSFVEFLCTN